MWTLQSPVSSLILFVFLLPTNTLSLSRGYQGLSLGEGRSQKVAPGRKWRPAFHTYIVNPPSMLWPLAQQTQNVISSGNQLVTQCTWTIPVRHLQFLVDSIRIWTCWFKSLSLEQHKGRAVLRAFTTIPVHCHTVLNSRATLSVTEPLYAKFTEPDSSMAFFFTGWCAPASFVLSKVHLAKTVFSKGTYTHGQLFLAMKWKLWGGTSEHILYPK